MEGSSYTAYWVCHKCGHKWSCRLDSRTKNMHGCPQCARSRGSSVNDYMLYKLLDLSLNCEVLYRYNVITGCEADVYIPEKRTVIEYDGYGYHKYSDKLKKDSEKDLKFAEAGLFVYRVVERKDRNGGIAYDGNIVKVPEITYSRFNYLKDILVEICDYWGILNKKNVSVEYYNIDLDEARRFTSKPIYEKSLKYILDNREDIFWDYDSNGRLPEDVYATIGKEKFYFKCKYGHGFDARPASLNAGYGCPICSNHRTRDLPIIEKSYNLTLLLDIPRDTKYTEEIKGARYKTECPFCGKGVERTFRGFLNKDRSTMYCPCLEGCSAVVIPLGIGLDNRLYYGVNIRDRYFLGIANSIDEDLILDKIGILPLDFPVLDDGRFSDCLGDPYIKTVKLNSYNTIPTDINKTVFSLGNTDKHREECYSNFKNQVVSGLLKEKGSVKINLIKRDIVNYLKPLLEEVYGCCFALNRTVDGLNRDLIGKSVGKSVIVRVNVVKPEVKEQLEDWFFDGGFNDIAILTDMVDFVDESKGFFYISRVQDEDSVKSVLNDLFNKVVSYFNSY